MSNPKHPQGKYEWSLLDQFAEACNRIFISEGEDPNEKIAGETKRHDLKLPNGFIVFHEKYKDLSGANTSGEIFNKINNDVFNKIKNAAYGLDGNSGFARISTGNQDVLAKLDAVFKMVLPVTKSLSQAPTSSWVDGKDAFPENRSKIDYLNEACLGADGTKSSNDIPQLYKALLALRSFYADIMQLQKTRAELCGERGQLTVFAAIFKEAVFNEELQTSLRDKWQTLINDSRESLACLQALQADFERQKSEIKNHIEKRLDIHNELGIEFFYYQSQDFRDGRFSLEAFSHDLLVTDIRTRRIIFKFPLPVANSMKKYWNIIEQIPEASVSGGKVIFGQPKALGCAVDDLDSWKKRVSLDISDLDAVSVDTLARVLRYVACQRAIGKAMDKEYGKETSTSTVIAFDKLYNIYGKTLSDIKELKAFVDALKNRFDDLGLLLNKIISGIYDLQGTILAGEHDDMQVDLERLNKAIGWLQQWPGSLDSLSSMLHPPTRASSGFLSERDFPSFDESPTDNRTKLWAISQSDRQINKSSVAFNPQADILAWTHKSWLAVPGEVSGVQCGKTDLSSFKSDQMGVYTARIIFKKPFQSVPLVSTWIMVYDELLSGSQVHANLEVKEIAPESALLTLTVHPGKVFKNLRVGWIAYEEGLGCPVFSTKVDLGPKPGETPSDDSGSHSELEPGRYVSFPVGKFTMPPAILTGLCEMSYRDAPRMLLGARVKAITKDGVWLSTTVIGAASAAATGRITVVAFA